MAGGSNALLEQLVDDRLLLFGAVTGECDFKEVKDRFSIAGINFPVLHGEICVRLHQ